MCICVEIQRDNESGSSFKDREQISPCSNKKGSLVSVVSFIAGWGASSSGRGSEIIKFKIKNFSSLDNFKNFDTLKLPHVFSTSFFPVSHLI